MTATLEFVNHASVLLSDGQVGVLSDPWYAGEVFHRGWSLLVQNDPAAIREVLARTDYIWISHEHPDHFSPPFFRQFSGEIRARGIRILFQRTRDARVCDFLRAQGFAVIEMGEGKELQLAPRFTVQIVRCDLYDSALLAHIDGVRVFNLNDCPLTRSEVLQAFAARHGSCDVLLTQFSYAAWKGGRARSDWRARAAQAKLAVIERQVAALKPRAVVPFASFVRFSHTLNAYMNDAVNTPARVVQALSGLPTRLVFMQPGERQALSLLQPNPASVDFWQARFTEIPGAPLSDYEASLPRETLCEACARWQARVRRQNAIWLMRLACRALPIRPFAATTVHVIDQPLCLRFDPFRVCEALPADAPADIALHSASLEFQFDHDFGFDTLFVNGCFEECTAGGFERFARCVVIGSLNAMGVNVAPSVVRRLDVIRLLLAKAGALRGNLQV